MNKHYKSAVITVLAIGLLVAGWLIFKRNSATVDLSWLQKATGLVFPKQFSPVSNSDNREGHIECVILAPAEEINHFINQNHLLSVSVEMRSLEFRSKYNLTPFEKLQDSAQGKYYIRSGRYDGGRWEVCADATTGEICLIVSYADLSGDY